MCYFTSTELIVGVAILIAVCFILHKLITWVEKKI